MSRENIEVYVERDNARLLRLPTGLDGDRLKDRLVLTLRGYFHDALHPHPVVTIGVRSEASYVPHVDLRLTAAAARVLADHLAAVAERVELLPERPEDPARSDRLHMLEDAEERGRMR